MDPSNSPFDNAQHAPNVIGGGDPVTDFGGRSVHAFFKFMMLIFIVGFMAAVYIFVLRPHGTSRDPAPASKAQQNIPDASTAEAAKGPVGIMGAAGAASGIVNMLKPTKGAVVAGGGSKAGLALDAAKQQASKNTAAATTAPPAVATMATGPIAVPDTITDVINSKIIDENGHEAGTIYDILVDAKSGLATNVIIDDQKGYRGVNLTAIHFNEVASEAPSGDMRITTDAATVAASQPFVYGQVPADQYVSLRSLEGTLVLDDQGKPAGKINAITYHDGSAQNFVFTIAAMVASQKSHSFMLPYKSVTMLVGKDGRHYIQLDHAQTAAIAGTMFPQAGAK